MKIKPWLWLSPSISHSLAPLFLQLYGAFRDYKTLSWKPFVWRGMEFTNPLGIAGGFDKNADLVCHLWTLGVGFAEVGTITPEKQSPNPGKIIDRDDSTQALWNKMGFPNKGLNFARNRLKKLKAPHFTPVFVNIGKNRSTPNDRAHEDYIKLIEGLHEFADAFIINISSPNTTDLRKLLEPQNLTGFLTPILEFNNSKSTESRKPPVLLKLSPDLSESELTSVLDISYNLGIEGWVLTNTTTQRKTDSKFPSEGGVSGKPLADLSIQALKTTIQHLGDRRKNKLLISAGGVMTPEDVFLRLDLGADLVQTYSGFIFYGPFFFEDTYEASKNRYYR